MKFVRRIAPFLCGLLLSGLFYATVGYFMPYSGMLLLSFLFLMPMSAGALTLLIDRRWNGEKARKPLESALALMALSIALAIPVFKEGSICLFMGSPFLLIFAWIGADAAAFWLQRRKENARTTHAVALIALPFTLLAAETRAVYPEREEIVVTERVIAAAPETIWPRLLSVPDIRRGEQVATFTHDVVGFPRPLAARLDAAGTRHVSWEAGVRFEERITLREENRRVRWAFHFDAESIPQQVERHLRLDANYLTLLSGDYVLQPLADGRTRLTLTTRYRMQTPVNAYAALWGSILLDDMHRNILSVIAARSETRT